MKHTLIIDIETMRGENPDMAFAPFFKKMSTKDKNPFVEADKIKWKKESILKNKLLLTPVASRLLSIGVIELCVEGTGYGWNTKENWHFIYAGDESEENMLIHLNSLFSSEVKLVTFNGRNFDFPFLLFRAAMNGVKFKIDLPIYPYNGKDRHFDLFTHLNQISNLSMLDSSWQMIGLKTWIEYFSLKNLKSSIKDGEINLEQLFLSGDKNTIEEYQRGDCENTKQLFDLFKGGFHE